MEKDTQRDEKELPARSDTSSTDQRRRRLAQAALAGPVLGALASKSALGAARQCSASVLMSGNTSVEINYDSCGGCSPGFWLNAVFKNSTSHACHLPCGVDENTTVGDLLHLGSYPENGKTDAYFGEIRNTIAARIISEMNASHETDFRDDVKAIVGSIALQDYADALFMFTRAALAAQLNALTLGANFPALLDSAIPSTGTIAIYIGDVFGASDISASARAAASRKDDLHASWDDTEEEACRMFSNCAGSDDCGVL